MSNQKRKARYEIDEHEDKRYRQTQPNAYRQNHAGKHANNRGGKPFAHPQPHTQAQIQQQLSQVDQNRIAQSWQQMQQMQQMFNFLAQNGQLPFLQQQEPQVDGGVAQQHTPPPPDRKSEFFAPYSDFTIPILWSTKIDHSFSPNLQQDQWDSTAWTNYYSAITMLKAGITRQQFGLPEAKEGHGGSVTIDYADLYLDLSDGKVYVAASERGLMTVPDYLKLCGIAWERKLRFTGKAPEWAKAVFDAAEKRYVTEEFKELPLPVRSEVLVLMKFPVSAPRTPAGTWGCVYSAHLKKVVQFPLVYTSDRELALVKESPGPLSAAEVKHVFAFPEKNPSPQELGEALFKQAEECESGNLDLQMTKSRDDYLQECGHLYGKYSLANTQEEKGIFFNPPNVPYDEDPNDFTVYEGRKGKKETFFVDWSRVRRNTTFTMNGIYFRPIDTSKIEEDPELSANPQDKFQRATLKHNIAISKPVDPPNEKDTSLTTHSEVVEVGNDGQIIEKRADETSRSKESGMQEVQAPDSSSFSPSANLTQNSVDATSKAIDHGSDSKASGEHRARRMQELRQMLDTKRAEKSLQKSSASTQDYVADAAPEGNNASSTIIEASTNEVQQPREDFTESSIEDTERAKAIIFADIIDNFNKVIQEAETEEIPFDIHASSSRKRKRSDSPAPPIKRVKTLNNGASTETSATSPTIALPEGGAVEDLKTIAEDNDEVYDDSAIDLSVDLTADTADENTLEPLTTPASYNDVSVKSAPVEDVCEGDSADIDDSSIDLAGDTSDKDEPSLAPLEAQPQPATGPDRAQDPIDEEEEQL
ncbi:uncharacterized protein N0V89_001521 [Didymosphaeria variabile]|uniref:Uncharacterized protein n=1 Tax=Didymosphaeria variabile TaxID=1932322 RepID=A0A9W8XWB0_9PLEO|nr:uncharacterized protein N0V89_001521 [Didymosphaeria variabile]KAJ4360952.1 hypothetical protein N0V89_001521 [Didymosphaeria variabile]